MPQIPICRTEHNIIYSEQDRQLYMTKKIIYPKNTQLRGFLVSGAEIFYTKTVDDILPFQPQKRI